MVSESRSDRIADMIKRELALLFLHEVSDPRLEGINITSVDVDRELAFANVYISALDGELLSSIIFVTTVELMVDRWER